MRTLIPGALLVVLALFLLTPVFVTPKGHEAQVMKAKIQLRAIEKAIESYAEEHGALPSAEKGLSALVGSAETGDDYLPALPVDPWGNPYHYETEDVSGTYLLFSVGADGAEGGTGAGSDIYPPTTDTP